MKIAGRKTVAAPRQKVWDAVTNPDVLARCIPGCESMAETAPDTYSAVVAVGIGPVSARFRGTVSLEDKQEPAQCRLVGSGAGGAAGFAKGTALVTLEEADGRTTVVYDVDVETGGKIASLGARMMQRVAESNVESFFEKLERELTGGGSAATTRQAARTTAVVEGSARFGLLDRLAWFGAGVGATLAVLKLTAGF